MQTTRQWLRVATIDEFDASRKLVCTLAGRSILLYRSGREVMAVANLCTHLNKPLDAGRVIGGQVVCPYHGACFDLRTGKAMSGPAVHPLQTFPVHIEGGEVFIALDDSAVTDDVELVIHSSC